MTTHFSNFMNIKALAAIAPTQKEFCSPQLQYNKIWNQPAGRNIPVQGDGLEDDVTTFTEDQLKEKQENRVRLEQEKPDAIETGKAATL